MAKANGKGDILQSEEVNSQVKRAWGTKTHFMYVYEIWDAKRVTIYFCHLLG